MKKEKLGIKDLNKTQNKGKRKTQKKTDTGEKKWVYNKMKDCKGRGDNKKNYS